VEEYGVITELYAYVAILMVMLTYGMETGLFKFSVNNPAKADVYSTSLGSVTITSVIFLFLVLIFRQDIAAWIGYKGNPEYIFYLGLTLAIDAVSAIVFAKLRIENKVRRFALLKVLNVVFTIFFVFLFLEMLPSLHVVSTTSWYESFLKDIGVGYVFIANVLASFIVLVLQMHDLKQFRFKLDIPLLKRILAYSLPLLISGLAGILNETIDRILIRHYVREGLDALHELGIYGANYRIAVLMTIFIQMFRYAAEPFFFNMYKTKDAKEIYANVLKYFTIFLMIIFLGVALCIDLFKYFIDSSFHEGLGVVPVVLMANVLVGILFNVNMWYKLTGHTLYGVYITGIGAVITIVLNILFIPVFSFYACAWIHVATNLVMVILTYVYGQKFYKINYDLRRILLYIALALGLYWLGMLLKTDNDFFNIGIGVIFVLIYVIICNRKEKLIKIFFSRNED